MTKRSLSSNQIDNLLEMGAEEIALRFTRREVERLARQLGVLPDRWTTTLQLAISIIETLRSEPSKRADTAKRQATLGELKATQHRTLALRAIRVLADTTLSEGGRREISEGLIFWLASWLNHPASLNVSELAELVDDAMDRSALTNLEVNALSTFITNAR